MASKRNLIILLIMPFVIALLSFNALKSTFNLIENDIVSISWDYNDNEMFALSNDRYKYELKATAINDKNYPAISQLNWSIRNLDEEGLLHAEIVNEGEKNYLHTLSEGKVMISVSNIKGNIQKSMTATIYEGSMIVFNSLIKGSQSNIDSNLYYGQYDLINNQKQLSGIDFTTQAVFEGNTVEAEIRSSSDNITYNNTNNHISFTSNVASDVEEAYVDLGFRGNNSATTYRYTFNIVKDGVNVYNYDDLLNCTNKSENGEIVVLRKNLVSKANLKDYDASNSTLFGRTNNNFKNEVYKFETRFNRNYIDQWNNFAASSGGAYKKLPSQVNVGIRVQKDFYGNGYTINMHDLAYPSEYRVEYDSAGNEQIVPQIGSGDIFRGPLVYYSLGDPNGTPIAKAYGQDNIGMYVDGDDITINDIRLKNCDFGNNLFNLDTTGTVLEVYGDNITIKNSVLSSGKNVLKVYDSNNVLLDNSMLTYSRNFLLMTGSYDYLPVDENTEHLFTDFEGNTTEDTVKNFLAKNAMGDMTLTSYTMGQTISPTLLNAVKSIQAGLDDTTTENIYRGDLTINDTLFYQSGITSIALETLFNGCFLYNASPSKVTSVLSNHASEFEQGGLGIPYIPSNVGGTSYPVKLTLKGNTEFFDYKTKDLLDLNGLVEENVSSITQIPIFSTQEKLNLDTIFPIKKILLELATELGSLYQNKLNAPIAYYGGGLNFSKVIYDDDFAFKTHLLNEIDVDFVSKYATGASSDDIVRILSKCVTLVSGFNPFKFVLSNGDGYLYGETPKVQTLIDNNK